MSANSRRPFRRISRTAALIACLGLGLISVPCPAAEIVVGFATDAETMDPGAHRERGTETILRNIYDGLVTRGDDMALRAQLAESWRQVDSTTYDFRLREGVRFHDGSPLEVDDVVFSFQRLIVQGAVNGDTSPRKSLLGPLSRVEAAREGTIRFLLSEPWPVFLQMLPFQQVVSRAFLTSRSSENMEANGTGPFRLSRWVPGQAVVLERFDGYYGGSPDLPPVGAACVDRVVFRAVPNNDSRVAGLLAGDFQMINRVPPHYAPIIEIDPKLRTMEVNGTRSYFLALNVRAPPFDDRHVRRAFAHAIDRDALIEQLLLGRATKIDGILSPDAFGKNEDLPRYEHSVETADDLLRQAGLENGVRLIMHTTPELQEMAKAMALQLARHRIDTRLDVVDAATVRELWFRADPPERAMLLTSWGNSSLDPVGIFPPTHRSGGRGNSAGYANPELDELLDAAAVELDREKRAALYRRAEAIGNRDLPYVYLWVAKETYGLSERVTGWRPRPDGRMNLHDVCLE